VIFNNDHWMTADMRAEKGNLNAL